MKTLNFYQLPRNAQDRFVEATLRRTVPKPIISRRSMPPIPWVWFASSVGLAVLFVVLISLGYGDSSSALALAPNWLFGVYGATLAGAVYAGLQAGARLLEARQAPFPYGKYVFPAGVIDATTATFRTYPLTELNTVDVQGSRGLTLKFQNGTAVSFKAKDSAAAEKAKERVVTARRQMIESALQDQEVLATMDPLASPRLSNPLAPLAAHEPAIPKWRKFTPFFAVVVGLSSGALTGYTRNVLSERRMFAVAVETNTPEAYRAYLERGGHRPDVAELRLPTAELAQLEESGNLQQLELYAQQNPDSKIKAAIESALREGLLGALEQAKKKETFQALEEFAKAHPSQALVQEEVKAARKALMQRVLDNFANNFAADDEELVPFMEKLLHHLAAHGPQVEVRFHRIVPDSVARADETVQKDKYFIQSMLPSQYFKDEAAQEREEKIFGHLQERFEEAFNPDALRLVHGKHLATDEELPNEPPVPTLFITHSTNMGHGIRNLNPNGTFVGVGFVFKAFFVIPFEEKMLSMKYSTWRPPDLLKLRKAKLTVPGVYTTMAGAAFDNFDQRVVHWLFRRKG